MMTDDDLISKIDAILPQTQCRECSYEGCLPYATAIVKTGENISRCAPGGVPTLLALASLLEHDPSPYITTVESNTRLPMLAKIREDECIGCTKCIQACPVDAIIGAAKQMHTILEQECTGCGLCVSPCPVDCIDLIPISKMQYHPEKAKKRYLARQQRLIINEAKKNITLTTEMQREQNDKQRFIAEARARVQAKKKSQPFNNPS